MGQQSCKRFLDNSSCQPKSALLNQQLLSEFVLPDKENYQSLSVMSISYIPEAAHLPTKYTDLLIALRSMKWKFEDSFYERQSDVQWRRLSDYKGIEKIPHAPISKFCQIIKFIIKNYPDLVSSIKPVYLQKSGFAVAKLWINGNLTEVIVDDYLPVDKMSYQIQPWALLLQKSMSKVLGNYKYLQQFSAGQIFSEVTGIPHYKNEQRQQAQSPGQRNKRDYQSKNFKKFKQVLKCDELLFQTKRFSEDSSIFGYHWNYRICHISFQGHKHKSSLIKISLHERQNISVRMIQPLQKYRQNYQNELSIYNNSFFQCFVERNGDYVPFGQKHQINNCIYLNSVFTNLQPANYFFYIRHTRQNQKLNFIAYGQTNIKLIEIYNQNIINNILFAHLKSKDTHKHSLEQIGTQVFVHIQHNERQIALFFHNNYDSKTLKLEIQNYALFLQQDSRIYREIQLNQIKGKWIVILSTNHSQGIKRNCFSII